VLEEPSQPAQRLGLRVAETAAFRSRWCCGGGAAERAGIAAGDEWLAVAAEGDPGDGLAPAQGWRIWRSTPAPQRKLTALVARDKRLLRLPLELPEHATTWRLALRDAAAVASWLEDAA
jgi:predicted metalloprotease with PDZ domain